MTYPRVPRNNCVHAISKTNVDFPLRHPVLTKISSIFNCVDFCIVQIFFHTNFVIDVFLSLFPAKCQHRRLPVREPGGRLHAQPDGARPAEGLPGHPKLYRGQAGNGGREREVGEAVAVGAAPARRHGDEERHHIAGGGPVPQDLHPEARKRQVGRNNKETICVRRRPQGFVLGPILFLMSIDFLTQPFLKTK